MAHGSLFSLHALRGFWEAAELTLLDRRRQRRMLIVFSLALLVAGGGWGVFFALRADWLIVGLDLCLVVSAMIGAWLTHRQKTRAASIILVATLILVVAIIAAVFDIPSAKVGRATHLYFLPLSVAALMVFREERLWLRHGVALLCLAALSYFAVVPTTPWPGHALPDSVRELGAWVQTTIALVMFWVLLHIMLTDVSARSALESDLRQAVALRQFELHYQPQLNAQGRVVGAEALLRWQHPQQGLVGPDRFIALAEQTGVILPLGRWVLETACAQLRAWAQTPDLDHLRLAVNVSALQFRQPDFVAQVFRLIDGAGIDPTKLELELTESMLVHDVGDVIRRMEALRQRGVILSLDDFGTGYSSLTYLKRLPLNQLKIDQSFVRDVLADPQAAAIVRTVLTLGQNMGLEVIAEGVETEGQREFLLRGGCHGFQGYLFSPAVPKAAFEAYARAHRAQPGPDAERATASA